PPTMLMTKSRITSAISDLALPVIPAHVRTIWRGETPACAQASCSAAARASRAQALPTRCTLLLEELPAPNWLSSSPKTHRVLVPPPSIPRKNGIRGILTADFAIAPQDRFVSPLSVMAVKVSRSVTNRCARGWRKQVRLFVASHHEKPGP